MGVSAEAIEDAAQQEREQGAFDVYEDNMQSLGIFLILVTQWRVLAGGLGRAVWLGIDYCSIPPVLDMLGVPAAERAAIFGDLRLMERAALPMINRKRDAE